MDNFKFNCDICGAPMKLSERLPNHHAKTVNYRRRRFKCTFCDYQKMIMAGGKNDEEVFPNRGIDQVNAIARQETKNREP